MFRQGRGYSALRRARISLAGATYFVTLCTAGRRLGLTMPPVPGAIAAELQQMDGDGAIRLRLSTIMPDHAHVVFRLGERLTLGQVLGRLKAKTRQALAAAGCAWQASGFDHRLRPDEPLLPVFHYVYMNPYRAGLVGPATKWEHFFCAADDWYWFQHHLCDELPHPSWLPEGAADRPT
jgi:REP element-mobilizing transposase RayT